jgi:hypothetical protein
LRALNPKNPLIINREHFFIQFYNDHLSIILFFTKRNYFSFKLREKVLSIFWTQFIYIYIISTAVFDLFCKISFKLIKYYENTILRNIITPNNRIDFRTLIYNLKAFLKFKIPSLNANSQWRMVVHCNFSI